MISPFAALFIRLESVYRAEPYFVGRKAKLLAVFNVLLLVFMPLNIAKLYWVHAPEVYARVIINVLVGTAALFSLRSVLNGRVAQAGNGLALATASIAHIAPLIVHASIGQPLGVAIQMFSLDFVSVLCAVVFGTRRMAWVVLAIVVMGNMEFHLQALHDKPIPGTLQFAASTLLREGLLSIGFVFTLGFALVRMIESAHERSETALKETRRVNENLGRLVSERTRELEAVSRRAQEAARVKSEFLANMSHEIRTPLNGIIASADLLLRRTDLKPEAAEQVRLITDSGELLLNLLGDILDFSKIEAGQLGLEKHSFELSVLIADCVALFAARAAEGDIRIETNVARDLPKYFQGDSYRLRQVLLNLLSNAIKFTPADGRVRLNVSSIAPRANPVPLKFEVCDSGIGMDEATQKRVFERFTQADNSTTRRYGGTGLGLAISSRLVEMMAGRLEVESTPGTGSAFYFTLPLPPAVSVPDAVATLAQLDGSLKLQVLVVEDNAVNRKILGVQLAQLGCQYTLTVDGEEALVALQQEPLPDIVLLDCHMPRLDGWETMRRIRAWSADANETRQKASRLPVIALTAAALPEERQRCLDAGMNDFLAKPVKLAELQRVLTLNAPRPSLA